MAKKSSYRNELITEIKSLSQSQGLNTVFTTFLEITATSIAAQMDPANAAEREKRYEEIASKMEPETLTAYARMFALLYLATREHAVGIVGYSSVDPTIGQICRAIAIGALSAILLILFVLPGMLAGFRRLIVRKKNSDEAKC